MGWKKGRVSTLYTVILGLSTLLSRAAFGQDADEAAQELTEETAPAVTDMMLITDAATQRLRKVEVGNLVQFFEENGALRVVRDIANLQSTINALDDSGGLIQMAPGDYNVGTQITLAPNVIIQGCGPGTKFIGTANIDMFVLSHVLDQDIPANGCLLRDFVIDGDDVASTGLVLRRYHSGTVRNVDVARCNDECVWLDGAPCWGFFDCNLTDAVDGWVLTEHDNEFRSNHCYWEGGRWDFLTGKSFYAEECSNLGFRFVNVEKGGTDDNANTGAFDLSNLGTGPEKVGATFHNVWCERMVGGFAWRIQEPGSDLVNFSFSRCLSRHEGFSGGDLDYGLYVEDGTNAAIVETRGCDFEDHTVNDIFMGDGNYWDRANDEADSVVMSGAFVRDLPDYVEQAGGWTTFASEDFEGVTAPAVPASLTSHADLVTSTSSPIAGTNSFICNTTPAAIRSAVFDNLDGNGGDARFTSRTLVVSGGTQYAEMRGMVRMDVNTGGESAEGLGFIIVADSGAVTVQAIKSDGGTETTPGTARALAFGTSYDISVEAVAGAWGVSVVRVSDGFYLDASGTFGATPVAFFSTTGETGVTAEGYMGCQYYRHAAGAYVIKTDNWLGETN